MSINLKSAIDNIYRILTLRGDKSEPYLKAVDFLIGNERFDDALCLGLHATSGVPEEYWPKDVKDLYAEVKREINMIKNTPIKYKYNKVVFIDNNNNMILLNAAFYGEPVVDGNFIESKEEFKDVGYISRIREKQTKAHIKRMAKNGKAPKRDMKTGLLHEPGIGIGPVPNSELEDLANMSVDKVKNELNAYFTKEFTKSSRSIDIYMGLLVKEGRVRDALVLAMHWDLPIGCWSSDVRDLYEYCKTKVNKEKVEKVERHFKIFTKNMCITFDEVIDLLIKNECASKLKNGYDVIDICHADERGSDIFTLGLITCSSIDEISGKKMMTEQLDIRIGGTERYFSFDGIKAREEHIKPISEYNKIVTTGYPSSYPTADRVIDLLISNNKIKDLLDPINHNVISIWNKHPKIAEPRLLCNVTYKKLNINTRERKFLEIKFKFGSEQVSVKDVLQRYYGTTWEIFPGVYKDTRIGLLCLIPKQTKTKHIVGIYETVYKEFNVKKSIILDDFKKYFEFIKPL